jgi:hypothetical protein
MMGARSSFFLQVYRRNAARQLWREERDALGQSQSLALQSQEPARNLDRDNGENERVQTGAGLDPSKGGRAQGD